MIVAHELQYRSESTTIMETGARRGDAQRPGATVLAATMLGAAGPDQLAWLTDDMLKPSTRSGGMAARVK